MKLILCRHGETDFNTKRRYQGRVQTPLNEKGIKQAERIAEKLKDEEFDAAFTSPLKRCRQTAEIIMEKHPETKLEAREKLIEIDYGHLSGKTPEELEVDHPGLWEKREANKYEFDHLGGETFKQVDEERVQPLLKEFREKYSSRTILVVTHQGVGRLIIGNLMGLPPGKKMKVAIPNDCIYYVDYLPHKTKVKYFLAGSGKEAKGYIARED